MFLCNNEILSFESFLLCESIRPKEINFGTDANQTNNEWIEHDQVHITFTKINNLYYCISISSKTGNIAFGTSYKFEHKKINDIQYVFDTFKNDRHQTYIVLKVFSYMIWILIQGALKFNIKKIKFNAADDALGSAYKTMMKNKYLINDLEKCGFEFQGRIKNLFVFNNANH